MIVEEVSIDSATLASANVVQVWQVTCDTSDLEDAIPLSRFSWLSSVYVLLHQKCHIGYQNNKSRLHPLAGCIKTGDHINPRNLKCLVDNLNNYQNPTKAKVSYSLYCRIFSQPGEKLLQKWVIMSSLKEWLSKVLAKSDVSTSPRVSALAQKFRTFYRQM